MFFYWLQIVGTIFFAVSGALSAYKKDFDVTSVMLIAFAVGNGGGTMRDVLIGATPVFWMQQPMYIVLTMLTGLIVFFVAEHFDVSSKAFLIADALELGVFAIAGAQKTLTFGLPPIVAIMMGVLSAVGGGIIRDVLSGDVPLILKPEIYATAALAGATVFVILHVYVPGIKYIAGISCALTVILIRLGTIKWGWQLPTPTWMKAKIR
ncbi:MAG: trimeric intracellular cation channel family protein [Gammaproteobacteria bacterium]